MATVFLGVGTNLGDRFSNLRRAEELLVKSAEIKVLKQSPIYETMPVGGPPQGLFLNSVWKIETSLSPEDLLRVLQLIEEKLGRKRALKNGPRTIDLDILDYEGRVQAGPELSLPHPRLAERAFILRPLYDIQPAWVHPELGKTVRELWLNHENHHTSFRNQTLVESQS